MGKIKFNRPLLVTRDIIASTVASTDAGYAVPVQTLTLSGVSGVGTTAVSSRGVTFITSTGSGAGWVLPINPPGVKGIEKTVVLFLSGASTVPVTVRTASSSQVFFGSTRNSISMTTAAGSTQPMSFELVAKTSKQWAIKSLTGTASTYIPFFTSTGATA